MGSPTVLLFTVHELDDADTYLEHSPDQLLLYKGRRVFRRIDHDSTLVYDGRDHTELRFLLDFDELRRKLRHGESISSRRFFFQLLESNLDRLRGITRSHIREILTPCPSSTEPIKQWRVSTFCGKFLFPFQQRNVEWMIEAESQMGHASFEVPNPRYLHLHEFIFDLSDRRILHADRDASHYIITPQRYTIEGAGLFDETGMGKTTCIAALANLCPSSPVLPMMFHGENSFPTVPPGPPLSHELDPRRLFSRATMVICHELTHWRQEIISVYGKMDTLAQDPVIPRVSTSTDIRCHHIIEFPHRHPLNVITLETARDWLDVTYDHLMNADFVLVAYSFLCLPLHTQLAADYGPLSRRTLRTMALEKFKCPTLHRHCSPCLMLISFHRIVYDDFHEMPSNLLILPYLNGRKKWFLSSRCMGNDRYLSGFLSGLCDYPSLHVPSNAIDIFKAAARYNIKSNCGMVSNEINYITEYLDIYKDIADNGLSIFDDQDNLFKLLYHPFLDFSDSNTFGSGRSSRFRLPLVYCENDTILQERLCNHIDGEIRILKGRVQGLDPSRLDSTLSRIEQLQRTLQFILQRNNIRTCPICYQEDVDNYVITPCGHLFCRPCMISFFRMSSSSPSLDCPQCRTDMRAKSLFTIGSPDMGVKTTAITKFLLQPTNQDKKFLLLVNSIRDEPPLLDQLIHAFQGKGISASVFETSIRPPTVTIIFPSHAKELKAHANGFDGILLYESGNDGHMYTDDLFDMHHTDQLNAILDSITTLAMNTAALRTISVITFTYPEPAVTTSSSTLSTREVTRSHPRPRPASNWVTMEATRVQTRSGSNWMTMEATRSHPPTRLRTPNQSVFSTGRLEVRRRPLQSSGLAFHSSLGLLAFPHQPHET